MRRTALALFAAILAIAICASSSLAKGDPDGQYRAPGNPTTVYVNRDGRMISYFVSYVHTSCLVGIGQPSEVIVQTTGKAKIGVSRKGRFSATVPFRMSGNSPGDRSRQCPSTAGIVRHPIPTASSKQRSSISRIVRWIWRAWNTAHFHR